MRVVVAGPGALGCFFAAKIACHSAHEVILFDHHEKRAAELAEKGLTLVQGESRSSVKVRVVTDHAQVGGADIILLCVKSHDVPTILPQLIPLAKESSLLVAMQNGISHHKALAKGYSRSWAVGVTAQGASLLSPGVIKDGGSGKTFLGYVSDHKPLQPLEDVAALFNTLGLQTEISRNILVQIWSKFIINVGINGLTVLLDCPNGQLLESATGRERMSALVREAALVAAAKGITIAGDPVTMAEEVCELTSGNISSMLQDVRRLRSTEIDAINGALLKEAALLKISVPENEKLVREIKAVEAGYLT